MGIVGESGCDKSTLGRTNIRLHSQTGGSTWYYGDSMENFMPAYVKGVYENLDKTWQHYEADSGELTHLETMSDGVVY